MTTGSILFRLAGHGKGCYLVLLVIFPIMSLPEAATGLVAKGVFDILQGAETVSAVAGYISFSAAGDTDARIGLCLLMLGGLLGLHVLHAVPYFAGYYWYVRLRMIVSSLVWRNMMSSVYRRPGAEDLPASSGEAISRFRGDTDEVAFFILGTQQLVSSVLLGSAALVLLMTVDVAVTLMVFIPLLAVVVATHLASARVQRYRREMRERTGDVTGAIGEFFGAVQAVQVAGAEDRVIARFREFNSARRRAGLKDLLFGNVLNAIFGGVATIGLGMVLLLVGRAMREGTFSVGDFALYQYYLGWIMTIPTSLGGFLIRAQQVHVSVQRMLELLRGESPGLLAEGGPTYLWSDYPAMSVMPKRPGDRLERLEAKGLSSVHGDTDKGVFDIDLTVERGKFVVVTGRVGSGKSTLLRSLLGLLPSVAGEVRWNDRRIEDAGGFFVPPGRLTCPRFPACTASPCVTTSSWAFGRRRWTWWVRCSALHSRKPRRLWTRASTRCWGRAE